MKRPVIVVVILSLLLLGCGKAQVEIEIKKSQIQEMLDKKFPIEKKAFFVKLNLHTPEVYFSGTQIGLRLRFNSNIIKGDLQGSVDLKGELHYDSEQAQFFLKNLKIIEFKLGDTDLKHQEKMMFMINAVVSEYLDGYPIYTLNQSDLKQAVTGKLLKQIAVKKESLIVTLGV